MNESTDNMFMLFAIQHHIGIMVGLVALSIIFGFFWSSVLFSEIQKKEHISHEAKKAIFQLIGKDERIILEHLCKNKAETSQAQLTKVLPMSKVKIFRTLQKLKQKELIVIEPNKRLRTVKINPSYLRLLGPNDQVSSTAEPPYTLQKIE